MLRPTIFKARITTCTCEYRTKYCQLKEFTRLEHCLLQLEFFPKCAQVKDGKQQKEIVPHGWGSGWCSSGAFPALPQEESSFPFFLLSFSVPSFSFVLSFNLFHGSPLKFVPQTSHPMSFLLRQRLLSAYLSLHLPCLLAVPGLLSRSQTLEKGVFCGIVCTGTESNPSVTTFHFL